MWAHSWESFVLPFIRPVSIRQSTWWPTDLYWFWESRCWRVYQFTRHIEKRTKFHDTGKRSDFRTFKSMAVNKMLTTSDKKSIEIKTERNLLGRLLFMSQKHNISLVKLFQYGTHSVPFLGPLPLLMPVWWRRVGHSCYTILNLLQTGLLSPALIIQFTFLMAMHSCSHVRISQKRLRTLHHKFSLVCQSAHKFIL